MATKKNTTTEIVFGLAENSAGALCYVLGWVSGLIFLLAEKKNSSVRFHAMQSLIFFGGLQVANFIPVVNIITIPLGIMAGFVVWLLGIYKAYNGEKFELPVIGQIANKKLKEMK